MSRKVFQRNILLLSDRRVLQVSEVLSNRRWEKNNACCKFKINFKKSPFLIILQSLGFKLSLR